ncbi:MAG: PP2C family protein-serine/threonine phosphatase [Acidimicrobiales bacterium]
MTTDLAALDSVELERIAAVRRYEILDTPADGAFDRIAAAAARLLNVPIAIVSIVDEDRIWFKSHHGLDAAEIPRSPGLCSSAILRDEPYVLPDARLDPVALTNPLVAGEFGLRFYAAVPLTVEGGHKLGTLCVIDREPRDVTAEDIATLTDLAALVVHELELRLSVRSTVGLESELRRHSEELAGALQAALLPPHLPRIPGIEVAAHYQAAEFAEVGGDFYDIFPLPRRGWGVALGDVCGKGPRAAAITAAARYAVRAAAVNHNAPSEVLGVLNETLLLDQQHGADQPDYRDDTRFCTVVYARLRPHGADFRVTVGAGGHPLPLVLRAGGAVEVAGVPGTLVGALAEATFTDRAVVLRAGDAMVFYTDGVTEAVVPGGQFGHDGLAAVLAECRGQSASEVVARVAGAVLGCSPHRQRDDVAIVALRVAPGDAYGG